MRLAVEGLACRRAGRPVFDGLTFSLKRGEALLVTGANGSGKSSLLLLLAGLLRPAAGLIRLEGAAQAATPAEAGVHWVGHLDGIKGTLSVRENLRFAQQLMGGRGLAPEPALERWELAGLIDFPARMLSAGQRRRLALARLLVSRRPIWLLDEPLASLDQGGQGLLQGMVAGHLAEGGMAVIASHAPLAAVSAAELRLGSGSIR